MFVVIFILGILFFAIIASSVGSTQSPPDSRYSYEVIDNLLNDAWDCKTEASKEKYALELESLRDNADFYDVPQDLKNYLKSETDEIVEDIIDLQKEKWEEKADKILGEFHQHYCSVVYNDGSFPSIDRLVSDKVICLRCYNSYFGIERPTRYRVNYKEYLKEFMEDDYDPCMESKRELENRLQVVIDEFKPERLRKKNLYSCMLLLIYEKRSIKRAELLKHEFDGFTQEEVKYCYKDLLAKYRIVEYRIGNPYFVTLSDAEKEKLEKKRLKKGEISDSCSDNVSKINFSEHEAKSVYTIEEAIQYLSAHGKTYYDNTPKCGCFWILYDNEVKEWIKGKKINGKTPKYTSCSGALHGSPGWYV